MEVSQSKGKDHFSGKELKADAGTEFQSDLFAELELQGCLYSVRPVSCGALRRPLLNMSVHLRRKLCELFCCQ